MKSNSRKFFRCMFCSSGAEVSKEHIFGKAISSCFPEQQLGSVQRSSFASPIDLFNEEKSSANFRGIGSSPLAITSSSMCRDCNARLGQELSTISSPVVKLFKGKVDYITKANRAMFVRYFQRIGLLIDLETIKFDDQLMTESGDDIKASLHYYRGAENFSQTARQSFVNGDTVDGIDVYLGRHKGILGMGFNIGIKPVLKADQNLTVLKNPSLRNKLETPVAKVFTFCIDKITCSIFLNLPNANFNPKLQHLDFGDSPFRLHPRVVSLDVDVAQNFHSMDMHLDGTKSANPLAGSANFVPYLFSRKDV